MKITFYLFSLLTIVLILILNPSKNNSNNFTYQSKALNFRSNQLLIYQLIGFSVFMFFASIVILLL